MEQFINESIKKLEAKTVLIDETNQEIKDILINLKVKLSMEQLEKVRLSRTFEGCSSDIIQINVGGTLFSTYRTTLTKKIKRPDTNTEFYSSNLLETFLLNEKGHVKSNDKKEIFIDRNPQYFNYILDYLRTVDTQQDFKLPKTDVELEDLFEQASFYRVEGLQDLISKIKQWSIEYSTILNDSKLRESLKKLCKIETNLKLIYRATRDGFEAKDFHSKCDDKPNTLTIIKTMSDYIFGGYTHAKWSSKAGYVNDSSAFIFSLINPSYTETKINCSYPPYAIYCYKDYGPTFGGGHDLVISNNSNANLLSYSNICHSYKMNSLTYRTTESQSFLAGSFHFQVKEIEVYEKV